MPVARRCGTVLALVAATSCGPTIGAALNRVQPAPAPSVSPVSARAAALHRASVVVDLHADPLLWSRDLARRSTRGHVDLPRLREGGVALQVFGIVTRFPLIASIERTDPRWPDAITLLAATSLWPLRTLTSFRARVLHQAAALHHLADESDGRFIVVESRSDLDRVLARHAEDPTVIGGLLDIEGAHALEADVANLDAVAAAGVRMIGLAHFYDNVFGGSAHGVAKHGLTDLGRTLVHEMERRGIVVDLAHSSPAAIADVLAIATRPLVVSHTGVRGTCDNPRNLSDDQLRGVARLGGVVGIGFWETAVCGLAPTDVARAIKYAVDLIGDDHVGLGSDFDGAVTTGFDASQLALVTQAMLDAGIPPVSVPKILGGNAVRVIRDVLP
jgi:microsomal dipeptidase-like Zn-dependent dipeptidase